MDELTKLSNANLARLPADIAAPGYDRSALAGGILHVGMGNFHRAHQAVYYDDLLRKGGDPAWAIRGAGVMPADTSMREGLLAQDGLYTVTEMSAAGEDVRVIGSLTGFLPVEDGQGPLIRAMRDPETRIVSLTVTEGGYYVSAETGGFNPQHPSIRADIAAPDRPKTVFGAIVAGLRARRDAGERPFTVMCCDNLPHNGAVTRAAVLGVAREQDADLAAWIEDNVTFPNGMVDRITPATTEARRARLAETTGIEDARPVFCEPFRQWVLEDAFCNGRPALEDVGVEFVSDVTPYEHMKLRMLNGGHAIIAYPCGLIGLTYVHNAMEHPLVLAYFEKIERTEIFPTVSPVPGMDQPGYLTLLQERFGNPQIEDMTRRLCFDGSNKQAKFTLASVEDNLAAGRSVAGLALQNALWCRYCFGEDESGTTIEPNDPDWDRLVTQAKAARDRPQAWLEMRDIYGGLARDAVFAKAFSDALGRLWRDGTERTLKAYIED